MSDDPLLQALSPGTLLIVTRPEGCGDDTYLSLYSARTGLSYIGKSSSVTS